MNPLSAIRQYVTQLPPAVGPAKAGGLIPAGELQDLTASQGIQAGGTKPAGEASFSNVLSQMVGEVNAKQSTASQTVQDLQAGNNVSLHQAMIAMEEASVSFQLMVEVRNRLLESYQELMRMQV
ncbi:MAG: flagellar hook-basal body complex protein FliE [Verrucomicrobia bacterium]|jgi:flagellar hook-basal body complex protein FliE|nr:flagellar hook-basal body complex protein FliE [Verrucomicrobiota bacterium]